MDDRGVRLITFEEAQAMREKATQERRATLDGIVNAAQNLTNPQPLPDNVDWMHEALDVVAFKLRFSDELDGRAIWKDRRKRMQAIAKATSELRSLLYSDEIGEWCSSRLRDARNEAIALESADGRHENNEVEEFTNLHTLKIDLHRLENVSYEALNTALFSGEPLLRRKRSRLDYLTNHLLPPLYFRLTGKRASNTDSGPYVRFVSAVMDFIGEPSVSLVTIGTYRKKKGSAPRRGGDKTSPK